MPPRLMIVAGTPEDPHAGEGQEEDQRQRQQRHERAPAVEQEDQDDERHHRHLLAERAQQRVLDAVGEIERS